MANAGDNAAMADSYATCPTLDVEVLGAVAVLTIDRPEKRNALDEATIGALGDFCRHPPDGVRSAVLASSGPHFSAGVDLSELEDVDALAGVLHSRNWHAQFDDLQFGMIPIVAALNGAVIGGGLELALAAHIRVADATTFYSLPEGSRGIFVGGGASVRLPRLIGVHRMADMMLTGRVLDADEGQALGISQYLVDEGTVLAKATEIALRIAENAQITNYAVLQALPRIAEMSPSEGLFMESLMAGVSKTTPEAAALISAFLEGRGAKVGPSASTDNGIR